MTPPTPLFTAFSKLGSCPPEGIHLTADESAALVRYIQRHGVSGEFLAGSAVMVERRGRPGVRAVVVNKVEGE